MSCNDGQSMEYCQTVQGCAQQNCPSECTTEFYSVLNCIWEAGGCKDVRVGDGLGVEGCGASGSKKKQPDEKKEAAVHPYPARTAATTTTTAATTASTSSSTKETKAADKPNPCSECSTSNGGVRNNFCGNIQTQTFQDACQSQTECADRGLKCQVCTEIVNKDGYGGESIEENVGNGAYICVKENEKTNAATTTTSTTTTAATTAASSSSSKKPKKKKKKKPSKGGFCHSRAVVLGNCVYSKGLSPDCIQCIQAGSPGTQDPTCEQVKQDQFCQNIATCAHEHCGTCAFEFYTGLNCALQKISGCSQFSCEMVAPPPHPTEEVVGYHSSSLLLSLSDGHASHDDDGYSLERFQDEVTMVLTDMQEEKDEEEGAFDVVLSEA